MMTQPFQRVRTILGLLLLVVPAAVGHELQDNRATLVLRDKTHVSVTLFIAYTEVLHLSLAPKRPLREFLLIYSAMNSEDLQQELIHAQVEFQSRTRLYLSNGGQMPLTNWMWPDAKQVQALLRQRVMQALVDPNSHEAPVEIHADANAQQKIVSLRVQFPEEFQKVLVVAFRPSQVWVERKTLSPEISF